VGRGRGRGMAWAWAGHGVGRRRGRGRGSWTYRAAGPVAAGVPRALVDLHLAAEPAEARPAGAGVAALARVAARRPVQTRPVVRAVVQIWEAGGGAGGGGRGGGRGCRLDTGCRVGARGWGGGCIATATAGWMESVHPFNHHISICIHSISMSSYIYLYP